MATASNPCRAAVSRATHVTMAVMGMCPLIAPAAFSSNSSGSRTRLAIRWGSPETAAVRAIGGAEPIENRETSAPERLAISIATAESLPPPTGTRRRSRRSGAEGAAGDRLVAGKCGPRQVLQAVGVGELSQALGIERLQQRRGGGPGEPRLTADARRESSLEVADPGDPVQQREQPLDAQALRGRTGARTTGSSMRSLKKSSPSSA